MTTEPAITISSDFLDPDTSPRARFTVELSTALMRDAPTVAEDVGVHAIRRLVRKECARLIALGERDE